MEILYQESVDVRDRSGFVLVSFEAHFSEVTFGTCLPSKTGRGFLGSSVSYFGYILRDSMRYLDFLQGLK